MTGTIEAIVGNIVTLNTTQGPLEATIGEDTAIQMFAEGTLSDLLTGARITVTGERGEDGTAVATSSVGEVFRYPNRRRDRATSLPKLKRLSAVRKLPSPKRHPRLRGIRLTAFSNVSVNAPRIRTEN